MTESFERIFRWLSNIVRWLLFLFISLTKLIRLSLISTLRISNIRACCRLSPDLDFGFRALVRLPVLSTTDTMSAPVTTSFLSFSSFFHRLKGFNSASIRSIVITSIPWSFTEISSSLTWTLGKDRKYERPKSLNVTLPSNSLLR